MPYTDIASIQVRTGVTYTGAELTYVTTLLTAIDKYIDNYTNRAFVKTTGDRWYYGNRQRELELDEFQSVTALAEYNSDDELIYTYETTDWDERPLNDLPKDRLYFLGGVFSGYKYKITGDWGYSVTCPEDIKMVATEVLANLMNQKGGYQSESIEGYSYTIAQIVETNPAIKGTLDAYRKIII